MDWERGLLPASCVLLGNIVCGRMADGEVLDDNANDRMLEKLYGPERNLLRDNHVSFMRKDNVLMKGMAYDLDCPQQSTTRASYGVS